MKQWIVIHHSLTSDGDTVSWDAIRKFHVKENGWSDVGYNFGIEKVNGTYEILSGRMPDAVGAHCRDFGMNALGIGICCVGNFDVEKPPVEQVQKLLELCKYLMRTYDIPWLRVIGHREAQMMAHVPVPKRKTCPGMKFDMEAVRRGLAQG
jgi:N-acetylmuramoyl-L-alanine amidase